MKRPCEVNSEIFTFILRLSSLGDIVLCSPLTKELAKNPRRKLQFISSEPYVDFIKSSFPVSQMKVSFVERKGLGLLDFFWAGIQAASSVPPQSNAVEIFDLHRVLKTLFWIWGFQLVSLCKSFTLKIHRTQKKSFLRNLSVLLGKDLLGPRYIFEEHLKLISPLSTEKPELKTPHSSSSPDSLFRILIAPEAQHWKKCWPPAYWEKLIEELFKKTKIQITLVGSARALPQDILDEAQSRGQNRLINLLGKTKLAELPLIASKQDLCLCGNSAWLHLSEACGVPVLSLAGPIVPGFGFAPWRKNSLELSVPRLPCRPCSKHGGGSCQLKGEAFHACMKDIRPDRVLAHIEKYELFYSQELHS